jgi:putative transposase
MPDHLHLLVEGIRDTADLQRFVKLGKQRGEYAARHQLHVHPLWQEGYHDWILRSDQSTVEVIRYVVENPVRAGLVGRWDEYPYSGTLYPVE